MSADADVAGGADTAGDPLDAIREPVDEAIGKIPGNTAGLGVLLFLATLGLLLSGIPIQTPGYFFLLTNGLTRLAVYGLVLFGLNMQFGDTGIANFGPVLFFAVGAYSMAILTAVHPHFGTGLGLPWVVGIAGAMVISALVGGFIGLTTLRLRGDYLAMVTLAAAEIFRAIVRSYPKYLGANNGISNLPSPIGALAVNRDVLFLASALFFLAVALVGYEVFRRLSAAPFGRVLRAILADEDAARSVGKNTFRYKMQVFIYGAIVAGLGGSLWALFQGSASPAMTSIDITILVWLSMMLGGLGNYRGVAGGLVAIIAFRLIFLQLKGSFGISATRFNALRPIVFGLLFILMIRYRPAGIWGESERLEVFK